jgi:tryptophan-rich sensory protein
MSKLKSLGICCASIALCLAIGFVSGIFTESTVATWYPMLQQPPGTPPPQLFAPVWTVLYVMMGLSLWNLWLAKAPKHAFALFYLQLFFNFIWSFCFFFLRSPLMGLADIMLINLFLIATMGVAWPISRAATFLLLPYLLWTFYATYLNFGLWFLN